MKIKEKIINLWNDPVWSKVISYIIISILSVITSGVITYYSSPSSPREALSVLEALLSYNLSINLFALLTIIILLLIISIIVICKNIFFKYDLFISAPMSGFDKEEDYIQFRTQCLEIKRTIEKECGFKKIYYAGEDKPSKNNFSVPRVAVVKDLKALRSSKRFLLIHPGKIEGVLTLVEN